MANIKTRCVQINQAVVLSEAQRNFNLMAIALQTDKGITINIESSYLSKYDVVNELRKLVKDKTDKPTQEIKPLLDPAKAIEDIVKEGQFDSLKTYVDNLDSTDYQPPLAPKFKSAANRDVYPIPSKSDTDPRRTGRIVKPGPMDAFKSTEVQKWLINNSVFYGYVLYSDNALYYVGVDQIKNLVNAANNKQEKLKQIVGQFLKNANALSQLTTTAQQVLENQLPVDGSFADPGNLEFIPNNTTLSNDRRVLDLVVINNQPVWRPVALAFLAMKDEAKKVGIDLAIVSGFRPGFGPNQKATTSNGRSITLTTQETLRRDKSRWISQQRAKYPSDDEFIFKAPASAYNAATAQPGTSNHGSGTAIDLNVGGRTTFSPLNSSNYVWLVKNAYKFGFVRTVNSEEWHWEYLPDQAKNGPYAVLRGTDSNKFYSDLGLSQGQFTV